MPVPTDDPLALLSPIERRRYRLADWLARHASWAQIAWNQLFMVNVVRVLAGRRLDVRGLEHLAGLGPDSRVLLVANHRSFFDFYVVGATLYTQTRLPKRVLFPVRASFFYDSVAGGMINAIMSGYTMFPPILREAERGAFNRFALARCIEELGVPGRMIGMHPEGRRGTGADPLELLRPQPGVGKIALATPGITVIPIWVDGLTNSMPTETRRNFFAAAEHRIDVVFGPPVAVEDLRGAAAAPEIAKRCMDAIRAMGAEQRAIREARRAVG
jgi:1-acyl-sn-glycerol-3-phosphate acyltransferase